MHFLSDFLGSWHVCHAWYVCTCIYVYFLNTYVCVYIYIYTHMHFFNQNFLDACMFAVYGMVYMHVRMCMCVYMNMYTHMYMKTYVHVHMCIFNQNFPNYLFLVLCKRLDSDSDSDLCTRFTHKFTCLYHTYMYVCINDVCLYPTGNLCFSASLLYSF